MNAHGGGLLYGVKLVPKRILILTSEDPGQGGGVESFTREMVRGLCDRGFDVSVFHRGNSAPAWTHAGGNGVRAFGDLAMGWYVGREAARSLSEDVAAVISNSVVGWHAPGKGRNGLPHIHFFHGTYRGQSEAIAPFITPLGRRKLKWWDSMLLERMSGHGKRVLCNSEQTAEEVRRYFGQESTTIWLPLDVKHFRPLDRMECRRVLGVSPDVPVGIFAGNLSPMKNFPLVRRLIDVTPGVHWILAIRGEAPNDLTKDLAGVTIRQDAGRDELPVLYNAADFAVCPSFYEPFGYVVAEALACGTPVIASRGGASSAFLREPTFGRFLIEDASSTAQFASAMNEIISKREFYRQKVPEIIWPRLVEMMAPENWWRRFFAVAQI